MSAEEKDKESVEPEVVEQRALELRRLGTPAHLNELAALDERGLKIIDTKTATVQHLTAASILLTNPSDWTLFRNPEGGTTGYLGDSGCDRVKKLWGIQIDNLRGPEIIESNDGTYAYQIFGDGKSQVTGECVFDIEGIRYSDERYAQEKPEGIQRKVAVRKAARANLDGSITRELAGLKSIPVEELDKAWEGTWKKSSMCNKGRGFGSKAERAGAQVQQSEIPIQYQPRCSTCNGPMKYIPAGTSKDGKPYDAFWSCVSKDHKYTLKHDVALVEAKRAKVDAERQPGEEG